MPAITERSTKQPLLKTGRMNHGTLSCRDITVTRRFYEEVLGLDVIQTSPLSLMVRKGTDHVYAVIETPGGDKDMNMMNHNGFEVDTPEDVDAAYAALKAVKDEWGLKIMPPRSMHGDHCFYFTDMDGNWWEIVAVRKGGFVADFDDKAWDLTGRHGLESWIDAWTSDRKLKHLHDPEARAEANAKV
jgi:catechol 2,3-dioxygenase-like lactoylglutathione lyase family enzyme